MLYVMSRHPARALGLLALAASLLAAPRTRGGDLTAFVALPLPTDQWGRGFGAALASTWFSVVTFEGEAARLTGEGPSSSMTSFTAGAFLAPPTGDFVPYGGVGIGLFRQTFGTQSDTGVLRCFVAGLKVRLGQILVVKGEYRRISLSGEPFFPLEHRYSVGGGISF
jgi:hypothetical protein